MLYRLSVHLDLLDILWMEVRTKLLDNSLCHDYKPGYLHAATCTSRTGTYKHQYNKHRLTHLRPLIKIRRSITRCGYDRCDLKGCMSYSISDICHSLHQAQSYYSYRTEYYQQICSDLLHRQRFSYVPEQHKVIKVKIDSEHYHKHRYNPLYIR